MSDDQQALIAELAMVLEVNDGEDDGYGYEQSADAAIDALLSHPALLRVLLEARKPCETCGGKKGKFESRRYGDPGRSWDKQVFVHCSTCHGSGSVPVVDGDGGYPCPKCAATLTLVPGGAWCSACHKVWREVGEVNVEATPFAGLANSSPEGTPVPVPEPSEGARTMVVERILWNRRGEDIDEIVLTGVTVHVEQMNDRCWWIGVYKPGGERYWMGNFVADSRGRMRFVEQENNGIVWDRDGSHEEPLAVPEPSEGEA